jgi:hypothetical protein
VIVSAVGALLLAAAPIESFDEPAPPPAVRLFGSASAVLGINVRPDADPDPTDALARNLFELVGRASLGVDVKVSPSMRVVAEGRLWWRGTTQPDFQRAKSSLDPMLGDAFVDFYSRNVDLRLGNQVVSFGANPLLAPADQLNPRDLRMSFLQQEPDEVKLPAPAIRATGELHHISWTAVYFPFFTPDLYDVVGTNEALLQPTLGVHVPADVSSSILDPLQPRLLETQRPNAWPWLGDLGLRATGQQGKVKLGLSWVWMNEKLPEVTVDPELAAYAASQAAGQPPDVAQELSLYNRVMSGQQLVTGTYQRNHIFSGEASTLVGSAQLDLDLSYSPAQTFVDQSFNPLRKPTVTWVVGLSQAGDSPLLYSVSYVGLAIPDVGANELLLLVEPATAQGAPRTAFLHVFVGNLSYRFWDERLEVGLRAALEPIPLSAALGPRVTYKFHERYRAWLGAEFYQGSALSLFGYFNRANQVVMGASADLF